MTRGRQNRPDRTGMPTAVAAPNLQPAPDAIAVVLADDESTRLGPGHKALVTLDGEPLIRRIVGTLQAMAGRPPIAAVRTADQRERLAQALPRDWGVRFIRDDPSLSGPLVDVTAAVDTVTTSWLFVAGYDTPFLGPHAVAALFECTARSDGDRDHDRGRHVSADGGHPSPPVIVPISEYGHEPLHALYRRAAVRDNVSKLVPDDGLGTPSNRLDGVEHVEFDALPESADRSVTGVDTRTELTWVAIGDEVRRWTPTQPRIDRTDGRSSRPSTRSWPTASPR